MHSSESEIVGAKCKFKGKLLQKSDIKKFPGEFCGGNFLWPFVRRTSETPTTTTSQKSIAIHLPFVLQYDSHLYRCAFGAPYALRKGNTVSTPPICIAVRLPFVSQYASHLYRNAFGKILVVVVTGMFPILVGEKARNKSLPTSTAKFKSEFGSFAAKLHTARIGP